MTPAALLERLEALGVTVRLTGDRAHPIRLSPADHIPAALRPEVIAHKAELAALLDRQARTWSDDPSAMPWRRPQAGPAQHRAVGSPAPARRGRR